MKKKSRVIVLVSGGLDSSTVLGIAKSRGEDILALSFDYGQRHRIELKSAYQVAKYYGLKQRVIKLDLRQIGGSALTDTIEVPKDRRLTKRNVSIPIT
ncbi:MAG: 7-cyano-7-deazaguanine synthase, partial [Nitrospirae bacterium]|nr:7-cyano-7-deazaguanine synthase [Nitrospirota bacterium]